MSVITHEISLDNFHKQIGYVLETYSSHGLKISDYQNVIIGGLGGSGIGGRIAKLAFFTSFPLPVEVVSEYSLPAYANEKTLVILSSYSGNTEETLEMLSIAKQRNCHVLAISSGGFLTKLCAADNILCYPVEQGYQPRMALGYSLSYLLLILGDLCGIEMRDSLLKAKIELQNNALMKTKADEMFDFFKANIQNKFVIVCDVAFEAVAVRICQQIQENAKGEAFVSVLPEANHNMIEGYYGKQDTNFIFLNSGLNPRIVKRFEFLEALLTDCSAKVYNYQIPAFNLPVVYEVIHVTDWLSLKISNAKGVNNMEVPNIARLKAFLDEKQG